MTLRCAYCHDLLGEPRQSCGACGSHVHPDCGAALGGCPTLGCTRSPAATAAPLASSTDRTACALLIAFLALLPLGFCGVSIASTEGPRAWAAEQGRLACQPGVAEAARRVMQDQSFVERAERAGTLWADSPLLAELPPELRRLGGGIAVSSSRVTTVCGGGFGTWGVTIARDPAAEPEGEDDQYIRLVGPGIWTWMSN